MERRLAAILAADVVGYSRLMEADEEATLGLLNICRKLIDERIDEHGGRVFGSAGDSVIAEFSSPVEAVRCAVEIQQEIEARNANLPKDRRMRFRIGVNLGDVMVEGDNLFGDGVNVAARLEGWPRPAASASPARFSITSATRLDWSLRTWVSGRSRTLTNPFGYIALRLKVRRPKAKPTVLPPPVLPPPALSSRSFWKSLLLRFSPLKT